MRSRVANGDLPTPLPPVPVPSFWPRVRHYAVPPAMIETATARRHAGDWAGACAAAGVDVDFTLRAVARRHGTDLAARLRADLRHLAPDLLRWHLPRIAPDGLLRPGLTVALARYDLPGRDRADAPRLVARTPPAWADAGQRIGLALWDGSRDDPLTRCHPHPHPSRRFRLDLHRHLWDARRTDELRSRSGADGAAGEARPQGVAAARSEWTTGALPSSPPSWADPRLLDRIPHGRRCAVERWAEEAAVLLDADRPGTTTVAVRVGERRRLVLDLKGDAGPVLRQALPGEELPLLPDAATYEPPDLELLRTGTLTPEQLHPLVAFALAPGRPPGTGPSGPLPAGQPRHVECRGALHRIGLVDGVLSPLDHDPAEIRREELLVALTGTPLPCLRAIDEAHRHPEWLTGVRERLDHGDLAGALTVVEGLLGPDAVLRDGALRDELETAAQRRISYGLFRAGLPDAPSAHPDGRRARARRGPRRGPAFGTKSRT
ncbi:hypothetical protein ACIPEL_38140 [Streptomyces griseoviridis]